MKLQYYLCSMHHAATLIRYNIVSLLQLIFITKAKHDCINYFMFAKQQIMSVKLSRLNDFQILQ